MIVVTKNLLAMSICVVLLYCYKYVFIILLFKNCYLTRETGILFHFFIYIHFI